MLHPTNGALLQASRVARGFARGRGRRRDEFFVEECEAEAAFIVTSLIYTNLAGIREKYPELEERLKFYRMSTGYGLKSYWSHRDLTVLRYLKNKGIEEHFMALNEFEFAKPNIELDMYEAYEAAVQNEVEHTVVQYYCMGNTREVIAAKLGFTPDKVKRILKKIRKRLLPINFSARPRRKMRTQMKIGESRNYSDPTPPQEPPSDNLRCDVP